MLCKVTGDMEVPKAVRVNAQSIGALGEAWLEEIPILVRDLAAAWNLSIGQTLSGGTEALVIEVTMADRRKAILKLCPPGSNSAVCELNTLLAGQGHGYVEVYHHDSARRAILIERLGRPLGEIALPVHEQIRIICETLIQVWQAPCGAASFMTGDRKAQFLGQFIQSAWLQLGRPCFERTIQRALEFVTSRQRAFNPQTAVLAHGDAHAWNALQARHASRQFKFIDPDGVLVEPAFDLGTQMREWPFDLLNGNPSALGYRRCLQMAKLTGVDPEPIWEWGFLAIVAGGLHASKFGLEGSSEMLTIADRWAQDVR